MTAHNGNTALIATIFNEAEDSLTTAQVVSELQKRGVTRSTTQISALLRSAEVVGRFIRSEINGRICWTNNPEWSPRVVGRKKQAHPAALECRVQPAETVVSLGGVGKTAAKPNPHNLVERLDAISQDLQDALDDALKARLSHDLIRHLVVASTAAQDAARRLVA